MTHPIKSPRKLIETALPLDKINEACIREKSIRHGHPSTLHLYWARRPLAAARSVIWAQMVNDPSWKWEMEHPGEVPPNHLKATWAKSRKRLFNILEQLVVWENTTNEDVLNQAREEIRKSWKETCELNADHPQAAELFDTNKLPAFHDPFAGGGTLPLEAQRLGLESWASDLNPVSVLINKAMIEIPPKFAGRPPIGPIPKGENKLKVETWKGAQGLAEDVRRYGAWIRDEAEKRIGHLFPKVKVTPDMIKERSDLTYYKDQELTVIAWLWARTVKSPDPAYAHVDVPLVSSFWLSTKDKKEVYVEPLVNGAQYKFIVRMGKPKDSKQVEMGTTAGKRSGFICLLSKSPIDYPYIRTFGKKNGIGSKLMAIVAEGEKGRVYLDPTPEMEMIAKSAQPTWIPDTKLPDNPRDFKTPNYGFETFGSLFTSRQLVALNTFSDLVGEAREQVLDHAQKTGLSVGHGLEDGGTGAQAYADAVSVYLGFGVDRMTNTLCSVARWTPDRCQTVTAFARQAIPMTWDYPEVNPFSGAAGDITVSIDGVIKGIPSIVTVSGSVVQSDAQKQVISQQKVISTDPPYYDNIGYADLSDFFYVWLRRTLRDVLPQLLIGTQVPKEEELVATPYRHGTKEKAEAFFLNGMTQAMHQLSVLGHSAFPTTIYYAFKQSESTSGDTASTGWETFLAAVIKAGFSLVGTWPMRTEMANRSIGSGTNALASSIVLVCRRRPQDATTITRKVFLNELTIRVHTDLATMVDADGSSAETVAPVDLAQAAIGPGMAVYSKYAAILNADGTELSVRDALILINKAVDSFFGEGDSDWDNDTKFCLPWFSKYGFEEGPFGDADTLSRSKNTSVAGLQDSGVLTAKAGKVRLFKVEEYPEDWNPEDDKRMPVWEALHHLIRVFRKEGQDGAGRLLSRLGTMQDGIRKLAYLLYGQCERTKRAEEARAYNEVMAAWEGIRVVADRAPKTGEQQKLDL